MKAHIKQRQYIWLDTEPREDIKDGIVVYLNKCPNAHSLPVMKTNINKWQTEYEINLPQGVKVIAVDLPHLP